VAVHFVLDSTDLAVNIQGAAGTGKTALLQELREGILQSNREVLAVAPTMSAVEELQRVGFRDAVTVERLLQDEQVQDQLRGRVLIVDEAGMVSGRQMAEVVHLSHERFARIVFSGDTRQIHSVEAADALRILEKESKLRSVSLTQVQRQRVDAYRETIEELRADPQSGFERLEAMRAIREVAYHERANAVAQAYAQAQMAPDGSGKNRSVLVVSATHNDIANITAAIRENRRAAGELGRETAVLRHVPLNWTEAQKRDVRNYRAGQVLEFHRAVKGVSKNESLVVVRVDDGHVIAKNHHSREHRIGPKQAKAFSVHEQRSIDVAEDDRLLLMANRREPGFLATNGELVTVRGIDRDGRIALQDGRTLPANYRQFTHGYAITAHRSQGKTVDSVVISADQMKKELFYVAASRGREGLTVITADKDRLRESIAQSDSRQSATELVQRSRANGTNQPAHGIRQQFTIAEGQKAHPAGEPQHAVRLERPSPSQGLGVTKSFGPLAGLMGTYIPDDVQQQISDSKVAGSPADPEKSLKQPTPEHGIRPDKEKTKAQEEEEIAQDQDLGFGF
jgi:ATP-dependent exoDNAse (exonuclease V) alpha subunit